MKKKRERDTVIYLRWLNVDNEIKKTKQGPPKKFESKELIEDVWLVEYKIRYISNLVTVNLI